MIMVIRALSILNLTTVTHSITAFQTVNLIGSNRFKTLLLVLLLRLLNPHITPILKFLHWLKVNDVLDIIFFSLSYLQSSYNQSLQPDLSLTPSHYPLLVTVFRPATNHLIINGWWAREGNNR